MYGEIAAGGMATVHFARLVGEAGFARTVAVKRLHQQYARMPEFAARFIDEARLAARIRHRNVVATLDTIAEDDELLLVMEYVAGESLSGLTAAEATYGARMPLGVALRIAADALYGLHAAHEAKGVDEQPLRIVHRDVTPQNILVGVDGMARVLDFGIAKAVTSVNDTREGQLKGKLRYMAPEQIKDGPLTAATDVYGLSVALWELLTGERLFVASNDAAILARVLSSPVVKPSRLAPHVPPSVDDIVLRGLHRDSARRFPTAHEMAVALESTGAVALPRAVGEWVELVAKERLARRAAIVSAIERGAPSAPVVAASLELPTVTEVDPPRSRRARWWLLAGALVAAAGAFMVLRHPAASPPLPMAEAPPAVSSAVPEPAPPPPKEEPVAALPPRSTKPPMRSTPPRRAADKRTCVPPYVEDPSGIRHIKPECLKAP